MMQLFSLFIILPSRSLVARRGSTFPHDFQFEELRYGLLSILILLDAADYQVAK